jgi:GGDEF domain-containing protein
LKRFLHTLAFINLSIGIRLGGEEFLVLLIHVVPDYSPEIAEKIRSAVQQKKMHTTAGFI